jgi:hypothetical protein
MVKCSCRKTVVFAHPAALVHSAMARVKTTEPWMVTVSKEEGLL